MTIDKTRTSESMDLLLHTNTDLDPQDMLKVKNLLMDLMDKNRRLFSQDLDKIIVYGSLCTGDFHALLSDIDVLILINRPLIETDLFVLSHMHNGLKNHHEKWFKKLDVSYIPSSQLYHKEPLEAPRVHLKEGKTVRSDYGAQWYFEKYMIKTSGLVVSGQAIDKDKLEVTSTNLRVAAFQILMQRWKPITRRGRHHLPAHEVIYGVLTLCRIICTIEEGLVYSKLQASKKVLDTYTTTYKETIENVIAYRENSLDIQSIDLEACFDFIRVTVDQYLKDY